MSRFRSAIDALKRPLEFALTHPQERLERAPRLRETLVERLQRLAELAIPPEAQRRFASAARRLEGEGWPPRPSDRALAGLSPLLDPDYPARALAQPTERIPGVGPKLAAVLARKEIHTVEDLLLFLPRAYEDRRELVPIAALRVGYAACFAATVVRAGVIPLRRGRRVFQAVVADASGSVQLKWFRGAAHFENRLRPGVRLLVAGDVRRYRYVKELHHPEFEVLTETQPIESLARIVPRYSAVEGIPPRSVRRICESALRYAADLMDSWLPEGLAQEMGVPPLGEALRAVHLPGPEFDPDELRERRTPCHLRLVMEELFLLQTGLQLRRSERDRATAEPLAADSPAVTRAIATLPFELTRDQRRVWREIAADVSRPHPMNRLLVGDVGTGKTVLAVLGTVAAKASDGLSALLAPTEILAEQHLATFRRLGTPLGLRSALLTGSTSAAQRRFVQRELRSAEVDVLIGTHALLAESLALPRLRLVVIDEQHRFGVEQRRALSLKGEQPHLLVMTATPIPRSLAFTLYGDLDHSTLRERPPGRQPVETRVAPPSARRAVLQEIRSRLARGEQVYVVHPLVEESEHQDLQDATRGYERLRRALPGTRVALLHGRLDAGTRSRVMEDFAAGRVQLLVCTTVIEVGVDVPGATLLVVEHAERFGLAQLHQLRGRIGRGAAKSLALLIGDPRSEDASRRLARLEASESGFEIAEEDLRIRGAGEWLGTRQAGHLPELRLADLVRHGELLPPVRAAAARLLRHDPELRRHTPLRAAIERRWGRRLELGEVA
ncbi:MAG: ATP-dependent DNA helicase RecG [Myxococcota bacterium]